MSTLTRFAFMALAALLVGLALGPARPATAQPAPPPSATSLRFSTYLGGTGIEISSAIALDAHGYVYVAGTTTSGDFPTRNPLQGYRGGPLLGADLYVAKLSPGGDTLVWATYLGGTSDEVLAALAVDGRGRVYVAGTTASADLPSHNALQGYQGGGRFSTDAFLARMSADGSEIEFATYLGGSGDDVATALTLAADGAVYVAGTTTSNDFPTTAGVLQPARLDTSTQRMDTFVARLGIAGAGLELHYATYLGGSWDEAPMRLAADSAGAVWITGFTNSNDFPTRNPLQATYAGPLRDQEGDVFLTRLSEDGSTLDFSTYLGGGQDDQGTGLALDDAGNVYLTGWTQSHDFPVTPGAFQGQLRGVRDRFVVKLAPAAGSWGADFATYLGTPGAEMGVAGLAVDRAGRVWVAGATSSDALPTVDPAQAGYGGGTTDAFLARLDASGRVLGYASYLGGSRGDVVTGTALGAHSLCLTGGTGSPNFPVARALQAVFDGPPTAGMNVTSAFVTCFETANEDAVLTRLAVAPDSVGLIARQTAQFMAEGFDQFDQPLTLTPLWTATGGTVDATGLYTAGDDAGLFTVTATDSTTGIFGTATVNVFSSVNTEDEADLPAEFKLYGNYPNPFNPQTTIRFDVKAQARVVLTLYDILGRKQATLLKKDHGPGRYAVSFDGRGWPSGVYFYEIEMGDFRAVRQMILVR